MTEAIVHISEDQRHREFTLGKSKLVAIKTDPYGFWHVEENGKKVEEVGVYTSTEDLNDGINAYLTNKK